MTKEEFNTWQKKKRAYSSKWATKPDFEGNWQFFEGIKNCKGEVLTKSMVKTWCDSPDPRIECGFCGTTEPYEGPDKLWCPRCREYKGIIPYIPEWSDWG